MLSDSSCFTFQDSTAQNYLSEDSEVCVFVFLRIHQLKPQRCSAVTVNGLGSVCCTCLCCLAIVVCVQIIDVKVDVQAGRGCLKPAAQEKWHRRLWSVCIPHLRGVVFSFKGHASVGECMQ